MELDVKNLKKNMFYVFHLNEIVRSVENREKGPLYTIPENKNVAKPTLTLKS